MLQSKGAARGCLAGRPSDCQIAGNTCDTDAVGLSVVVVVVLHCRRLARSLRSTRGQTLSGSSKLRHTVDGSLKPVTPEITIEMTSPAPRGKNVRAQSQCCLLHLK